MLCIMELLKRGDVNEGKEMKMRGFWTPIMVVLGIAIIVMFLFTIQELNAFDAVNWSLINPEIIEFAPWIVVIGIAFVVFLYLRR